MIRQTIRDTAPEGVYERKKFEQVMRNAAAALEITLGYAMLEVRSHPPNIHFAIHGPEVIVNYHMFGNHVQIQAVGKDEYKVGLVKEAVEKEIMGLEAKIAAA